MLKFVAVLGVVLLMVINSLPKKVTDLSELKNENIQIIVQGAVQNPGLYEVTAFSTIAELLEQLELDPQACLDTINPLIVLKNNDILNIPYQTEDYLISINTASREELMTLVGVKAKTADAIIAYRSNIGLFQTLEELMEVKGIGIKKFEKLKPLIKL